MFKNPTRQGFTNARAPSASVGDDGLGWGGGGGGGKGTRADGEDQD